jgi:hypothetical protein
VRRHLHVNEGTLDGEHGLIVREIKLPAHNVVGDDLVSTDQTRADRQTAIGRMQQGAFRAVPGDRQP